MKSWKFARVCGIDLKVHWSFLALLAWVAVSQSLSGGGLAAAVSSLLLLTTLFFCVVLHEFGHALAARRYGIPTHDITLLPIGGVARLERMPTDPRQELVVAIAGPAVNVVIAGLLFAGLMLLSAAGSTLGSAAFLPSVEGFLGSVLWVNSALVVFNLLPAFPMDGGRILRAGLATRTSYVRATRLAARAGQTMAIAFGIVGFFSNPFLILIALFVFVSAGAEARQVEFRDEIRGIPVHRVMQRSFYTLSLDDSLRRAGELLFRSGQSVFPIVDNGRVVGLATEEGIIQGLDSLESADSVQLIQSPLPECADPRETLDIVLDRLQSSKSSTLPVLEMGRVIGLISRQHIQQAARMKLLLPQSRLPQHTRTIPSAC